MLCDVNVMCYICDFTSLVDWAASPTSGRLLLHEEADDAGVFVETCMVLLWMMVMTPARCWSAALRAADEKCGEIQVRRRRHTGTGYVIVCITGSGGGVVQGMDGAAEMGGGRRRHVQLRCMSERRCVCTGMGTWAVLV